MLIAAICKSVADTLPQLVELIEAAERRRAAAPPVAEPPAAEPTMRPYKEWQAMKTARPVA